MDLEIRSHDSDCEKNQRVELGAIPLGYGNVAASAGLIESGKLYNLNHKAGATDNENQKRTGRISKREKPDWEDWNFEENFQKSSSSYWQKGNWHNPLTYNDLGSRGQARKF